jgi:dTDP-L-rhamnose 4-epimerase
MKNILISGGAGFIGAKLSVSLLGKGYNVAILDNLSPQIHGAPAQFRSLDGVDFIKGDVRNKDDWHRAIKNVHCIVHLAAETGTGQSMYEVHRYSDHNINGTAIMLDYIVNESHEVNKVIVASSRAVYGEGKYQCKEHGITYPGHRKIKDLADGKFEPVCPVCDKEMKVLPTDEESKIHPSSVYGITKMTQEQMVLNVCQSLNIPAVAFRYQNVYGPGQSLKNPYTGILSIFSTLIRNGKNINIFEDGQESRDFVYVDDVVNATLLGIESATQGQEVFNVGSGNATTVLDVAKKLKEQYQSNIEIAITGDYRIGDIRHNIADLSKIKSQLGFKPQYSFDAGIAKFCQWVLEQEINLDKYEESISEMKTKGLLKSL